MGLGAQVEVGQRVPRAELLVKRLHELRELAGTIRTRAGIAADKIVGADQSLQVVKEQHPVRGASCFLGDVEELVLEIQQTLGYASESLGRFDREF